MNELITQLALKASNPKTGWLDRKKFAELIVRECANIAYGYDAPKMSGLGMIIAGRIESHFGVEE